MKDFQPQEKSYKNLFTYYIRYDRMDISKQRRRRMMELSQYEDEIDALEDEIKLL